MGVIMKISASSAIAIFFISVAAYSVELHPGLYVNLIDALNNRGENINIDNVSAITISDDSTEVFIEVFVAGGGIEKKSFTASPYWIRRALLKPVTIEEVAVVPVDDSQNGRLYFTFTTLLRSLYVYPMSYGLVMDDAKGSTVAGLTLLTLGGSIFASYQFTKNMELGYGRVAQMNYGGELGVSYSNLLGAVIQPASWKPISVLQMVAFPAGIYLGSKSTLASNHQYGNAAVMRYFGRSAFLYGFLLPLYPTGLFKTTESYFRTASLLTMGLIPCGIKAGHSLSKIEEFSSGRSLFLETSGIMGALSGFGVGFLILPSLHSTSSEIEKNTILTSVLVGHAAASYFGLNYHKERRYTMSQAVFSSISAAGGTALGLSIPLLMDANGERPYITAALLGGWAGLLIGEQLSISLFDYSGRDKNANSCPNRVSFPVAYEWPLLLQKKHIISPVSGKLIEKTNTVDVVRLNL